MWLAYALFIIIGGDQLTAARTRSSKRIRSNSVRGRDRLDGLEPMCEDWHAKVCLLGVSKYACTVCKGVCLIRVSAHI